MTSLLPVRLVNSGRGEASTDVAAKPVADLFQGGGRIIDSDPSQKVLA